MLILSRNCDEVICVGDSIRITVLEIRGNKARIGIDAPKDVKIVREEILNRGEERDGGSTKTH